MLSFVAYLQRLVVVVVVVVVTQCLQLHQSPCHSNHQADQTNRPANFLLLLQVDVVVVVVVHRGVTDNNNNNNTSDTSDTEDAAFTPEVSVESTTIATTCSSDDQKIDNIMTELNQAGSCVVVMPAGTQRVRDMMSVIQSIGGHAVVVTSNAKRLKFVSQRSCDVTVAIPAGKTLGAVASTIEYNSITATTHQRLLQTIQSGYLSLESVSLLVLEHGQLPKPGVTSFELQLAAVAKSTSTSTKLLSITSAPPRDTRGKLTYLKDSIGARVFINSNNDGDACARVVSIAETIEVGYEIDCNIPEHLSDLLPDVSPGPQLRCVVYVVTEQQASAIYTVMTNSDHDIGVVDTIAGKVPPHTTEQKLERFLNGHINVLICTKCRAAADAIEECNVLVTYFLTLAIDDLQDMASISDTCQVYHVGTAEHLANNVRNRRRVTEIYRDL